jgi:membrane protein YqaA with SNARE-associated domain
MRRLFITLAIAIVVIVMFLAAAIVRFEPAVVVTSCWPNNAMLAIAIAFASAGCCLGVVTGLFAGGGVHDR